MTMVEQYPTFSSSGFWLLASGFSLRPLAFAFATPMFFAAGILLAAIPIIIHILNRRRFKTVQWAAMDFLLRAMRRNRRRLKFEQWLLLATRCALLFLLGLALARPLGCDRSSFAMLAQRSGLHVLVIDNSYSMAYEADRPDAKTHLDQAKLLAKGLIDRLTAGGESVAIITAAKPATAVIASPAYDLQAAKDAVDRIEQSYSDTDLVGAITKANEIARDEAKQPVKFLDLFTDATRSAWEPNQKDALAQAGRDAAQQFRITHHSLARGQQSNLATLEVRPSSNLVRAKFNNEFLATIRAFGGATDSSLQWRMDGQILPGRTTAVRPSADSPPVTLTDLPMPSGGPHVLSASLMTDDRLKVDDTRWRVLEVASELKVLIVEGERGIGAMSGSGAFLNLALAPPAEAGSAAVTRGRNTSSYVAPELISDLELSNKVLSDYRAVILCGVGQIQPGEADQIRTFVERGGSLLIFMGEPVTAENYNSVLLPRKLMPGPLTNRVTSSGDQNGFNFDFQPRGVLHPLLSIFAGEEKSGLDTARVFTYWQADIPSNSQVERVLNYLPAGATPSTNPSRSAQATNADPAITMHSVGQGHVIFVSTTANDEWQSFCAKPSYLVLMHELLTGSVSSGDRWMNLFVGQPLEIPANVKLTATPSLKDANQTDIVLDETRSGNGPATYRSRPLTKPGVYTLNTGERKIPIAVNVPDDEADIRTLDDAALTRAMGEAQMEFEGDQLPALAASNDSGNDYGWSIMAIVLVLVGFECFLAMRFGHYRKGTI